MKTFIIGDLHGCDRALKSILKRLAPDEKEDRLILLGDLYDRGPDSWEVFQTVKGLADVYGDRFVLLRGNHEDYLLAPKLSFTDRRVWNRVGKKDTVRSFKEHGAKMEDTAGWIRDHCVLFYKGDGYQCVHAGIKVDPLEENDLHTMIHDHGIVLANRYSGPLTIVGHIALAKPTWFGGTEGEEFRVERVEGDSASGRGVSRSKLQILEENVWYRLPKTGVLCIDAGCGKDGRLIGMEITDGKFILRGVAENGMPR